MSEEPFTEGGDQPPPVPTARRLFGGILFTLGLLIMLSSGGCGMTVLIDSGKAT